MEVLQQRVSELEEALGQAEAQRSQEAEVRQEAHKQQVAVLTRQWTAERQVHHGMAHRGKGT